MAERLSVTARQSRRWLLPDTRTVPRVAPIRVVYRKYDGSPHWHTELTRLGTDELGTWAAVTSDAEPFRQVCRDWLARVPGA
jgi:hypothetical protein